MKPTAVVVADKGTSKGIQKLVRRPSKKGLLPIVAALIGAAVLVGGFLYTRPALKIGSYSYSRGEYKNLVSQAAAQKISEQDARQALIAGLASRAAADELDVNYSTDEYDINRAARYKYDVAYRDKEKVTDYQEASAWPLLVSPYVRTQESGGTEAAVIYYPFSRYLYGFFTGSQTDEGGADPALIGNKAAIQKDITDATNKANAARDAYIAKQKTLPQLVDEVQNDGALLYGQAGNKSKVLLLTAQGNDEDIDGTRGVPDDLVRLINDGNLKAGVPSEINDEILYGPSFPAFPQLNRPNGSIVGKYFVVIDKKFDARPGVEQKYQTKIKELSR